MKCSPECPNFEVVVGFPGLGYCELVLKDSDDPLDGLVKIGFDCERS